MSDFVKSFWSKVDRRGPDECWPWLAALFNQTRYGQFWAGVTTTAHRFSWELANRQKAPPKSEVRHSCHNRACVNPAHLSIGTHVDNARDMVEAGRQARREQHSQAKLSSQSAFEIRMFNAAGMSQSALARAYGVALSTVNQLIKRRTWAPIFQLTPELP